MEDDKFVLTLRFVCENCGWEGPPFVPYHSVFDIYSCMVCNPPPDGKIMFDPKKTLGNGCPGCKVKFEKEVQG